MISPQCIIEEEILTQLEVQSAHSSSEESRRIKSVRSNSRVAACESARAECTYVIFFRHKPKRPEGTNSVVAASRTEERSSFYHVSREREGKGREYDAEEVQQK